MSVIDVVTYPNPILRQKAQEVTQFDDALLRLSEDMFETMRAYQGVGLAGPQIAVLQRIFVLEYKGKSLCFVNPELSEFEGEVSDEEGCLSLPEVGRIVTRAESVFVKYQTVSGQAKAERFSGYIARIIQHEFDHLDGVLILDRSNEAVG